MCKLWYVLIAVHNVVKPQWHFTLNSKQESRITELNFLQLLTLLMPIKGELIERIIVIFISSADLMSENPYTPSLVV